MKESKVPAQPIVQEHRGKSSSSNVSSNQNKVPSSDGGTRSGADVENASQHLGKPRYDCPELAVPPGMEMVGLAS